MRRLFVIMLLVIPLFTSSLTHAQEDNTCPALVQQALAAVGEACAGIGRNQVCYGHNHVTITNWDSRSPTDFENPGDKIQIVDMAAMATAPLNLDDNTWGVALMALQANLPDTLPGQNVTFVVFGEASLRSEVAPVEAPVLVAQASANVNVRTGPGTDYAIMGSLRTGDEVPATGRTEAGDWLRVDLDGQAVWVFAALLVVEGDAAELATIEYGGYNAPMQAFRLTTGVGESQCAEAPRDGVLIQAPQGTTVSFLINGIGVEVGSTALLTAPATTALDITTLGGKVTVTSAGMIQVVEPGFTVTTAEGQPPGDPVPSPEDAVQSLPVQLLPEPVESPASDESSVTTDDTSTTNKPDDASRDDSRPPSSSGSGGPSLTITVPGTSDWVDSGLHIHSGQTFILSASGTVNPCVGTRSEYCVPQGPEGIPNLPGNVVAEIAVAALIGRIDDGPPFFVGSGGTFTADRDGTLQFRINDEPLTNNEGAFTVTISFAD